MRRFLSLILILGGASLVAACATERPHFRRGMDRPPDARPSGPGGPGGGMMRGGLFVSPAGEPFRRTEGRPQPMQAWFSQVDADHDGTISWPEFEADFVCYFAALDVDHDGEIAPPEVARYETEILPEMASRGFGGRGGAGMGRGMPGGGMGGRRGGMGGGMRGGGMRAGGGPGGGGMAGMAMLSGAARFGLLPIAHPIMDADTNFNRGVSHEEFTQAAAHRFAMLNTQNSGRLTLPQLVEVRMQTFSAMRRGARARPRSESGGGDGAPPDQPDGD